MGYWSRPWTAARITEKSTDTQNARAGMVASRRSSAKDVFDEINVVKGKRRRRISPASTEAPRKRLKRNTDPFSFESDVEEDEDVEIVVNRTPRSSSKNTPRKETKRTADGVNGTPRGSNRKRNNKGRDISPSSDAMEVDQMSEDELISAPVTPSRSPRKTPTKKTKTTSTPSRRGVTEVDELVSSLSPVRRTKFQDKLKAVAASSPGTQHTTPATAATGSTSKDKRSGSKLVAAGIVVGGTHSSTSKSKVITHEELENIKSQVLSKLCGRQLIPLQGNSLHVAEYPPSPLPTSHITTFRGALVLPKHPI